MRVGLLVTGDAAVRAAHSLGAHPTVDEVVVIGPARSTNFEVVKSAEGCDYLLGHGPRAPAQARQHRVPLIWDGEAEEEGVAVWGASPQGLTLALADRESEPRLIAVAHPELPAGNDHHARFPQPLGRLGVADGTYAGRRLAMARSPNSLAACLAIGVERRVTIVDEGPFMSGISLAAAVDIAAGGAAPVWERPLDYLTTATDMGLVMAEGG